MSHVITLVGNDARAAALGIAQQMVGHVDVLTDDATDVFIANEPTIEQRAYLATFTTAVDLFVQPVAGRQKRVLLADMESTLIENEFLDDIAARYGVAAQVKAITQRGMEGGMSFQESLQQRLELLRGAPVALLDDALANWRPSPGVKQMMAMLTAAQIPVWLVSSGFTYFTEAIGAAFGCVVQPGNVLEIEAGRLRGSALPPIKDQYSKRAALDAACTTYNITLVETAAVGDGANDLLMLQAAGAGFGHRAKPAVADACRFNIRHSDLRAIAFAFGLKSN